MPPRKPVGLSQPLTDEQIRQSTVGDLAVHNGPITLVAYDPSWPEHFAGEARRIGDALGARAVRIEHIGSTSVPGLIAKPIIDIVLVVADSADEPSYVPALEAAGYVLRIREPEWHQHRLFKGPDVNINLHVFSAGCDEIERCLLFRDWLRAHPADRDLYAQTKRELAQREWRYVQNYADAKSEVVEDIIARARIRSRKMATTPQPAATGSAVPPPTMILPAYGDAVRIVPLQQPDDMAAAQAAAAQFTYRGGPLISAAEVFTVFWGAAWQQPQSDLASKINQFFDFIVTSALIDQLAEYNVPAYTIGHGKRIGSATITTPSLGQSVTDSAIQHMLQQEISTNTAFPQPSPDTLYFVYLPPGVKVVQGGSASCQAFCGYHNDISGRIFYAAMPYPGCAGCTGGLAPFDALTSTSSHELCEAITDAIPGQGWYDDANGEIGDICAWKTKQVGAYTVQLEWSNAQNKCV